MDPSSAYLLVGSAGATGAALALGTLGALLRIRREGGVPDDGGRVRPASRGHVVGLWARVAVGVAVTLWAVAYLNRAGLLQL